MFKKILLLLGLLTLTFAYTEQGNLLKLTGQDFTQALQEFPHMLVKFFAPWCGHCKKLAPIYIEVADSLKQNNSPIRIAEVDCTVDKELCQKYGVKGYPTVNFFSKESQPIKYSSARTKEAMVNWLTEQVKAPEAEAEVQAVEVVPEEQGYKQEGSLYILSEATYKKAIEEFDFMMVKFYAPWCGHCKKLAPIYVNVAENLAKANSPAKIAEVDCTIHKSVCTENGVRGYPTVMFFVKGTKEGAKYGAARTEQAMVQWINKEVEKSIPAEPVPEVQEPTPEQL